MGTSQLISVWGESFASAWFVCPRILLLFPNLRWSLGLAKRQSTHHPIRTGRIVSLHLRGFGNPWVMEVTNSLTRRGNNAGRKRMD